ncbi:hypothetical protein BDZ90DRAFT_230476 [Jaminaea rosea]|uniref:RING-type domain-containing protein n=1 Tax=Jaminaea rosea TaxID=1569628 RepID=A0A316UWE8_9BASI|nr:hypothetical protein BDZ90DRAFT_230476 [Jaminaea rosea]PWN29609.1 hypothetical protein BDZ90DRAFT_230476 [Jaminaea rosea]
MSANITDTPTIVPDDSAKQVHALTVSTEALAIVLGVVGCVGAFCILFAVMHRLSQRDFEAGDIDVPDLVPRRRTGAGDDAGSQSAQSRGIATSILATFPTFVWRAPQSTAPREIEDQVGDTEAVEMSNAIVKTDDDTGIAARRAASVDFMTARRHPLTAHRARSFPTPLCTSGVGHDEGSNRSNSCGGSPHRLKRKTAASLESIQSTLASQTTCPICTDDFGDGEILRHLPCTGNHLYHATCIDEWLSQHRSCPLCRQDLQPENNDAQDELDQPAASTSASQQSGLIATQAQASTQSSDLVGVSGSLQLPSRSTAGSRPSTSTSWRRLILSQRFEEYQARKRARRQQLLEARDTGNGIEQVPSALTTAAVPHATYIVESSGQRATTDSNTSHPNRRLRLLRRLRNESLPIRPRRPLTALGTDQNSRHPRPRPGTSPSTASRDYAPRIPLSESGFGAVDEYGGIRFMPFI